MSLLHSLCAVARTALTAFSAALLFLLVLGLPQHGSAQPVALDNATALSAGGGHSCAALGRGGARCWGFNFLGQLGDGTRSDRLLPVAVSDLGQRVIALANGDVHSCAILDGGSVRCWGMNFYGQLGDGTTELGLTPVTPIGLGSGVQQIGGGENHSCALTAAGGVKCWGANYSGQLGDGTGVDRTQPVDVVGLTSGVIAIGVGHRHTCAVTAAGAVKCWGFNFFGQLGNGSQGEDQDRLAPVDVVGLGGSALQVSGGTMHTCALLQGGMVSCWGANSNLQLGNDGDENNQPTPAAVIGLDRAAARIDLGGDHSCVLTDDGRVRCWGRNDVGQLGDGGNARNRRPVEVVGLRPGVQAISIGQNHGCALQVDSTVRCWGLNFSGQLGDGGSTQSFAPKNTSDLPGAPRALGVAVGEEHSCAVGSNNAAYCWGLNFFGQLGDGGNAQRLLPDRVNLLGSGVTRLDAGGFHSCAVQGGGVFCWGANAFGQLGGGDVGDRTEPVAVVGLGDSVLDLAVGGLHSCALRGGGVQCWGHNFAGQLGDGSEQFRTTPVAVLGLSTGVSQIAASFAAHSCAALATGGVRCWGANERGQLGDGSRTTRLQPVAVPALAGRTIRSLSLGAEHSCAVLNGGSVQCWGSNSIWQLGNENPDDQLTPVPVAGLESDVQSVALGRTHSCALTLQGAVLCWGRNDAGQLGDGSSLNRAQPVPVSGLGRGVVAIDAGAEHNCALLDSGAIRCWGSNYSGQFGDGSFGGRPVPVEVKRDGDARRRPTPEGDAAILRPASDASGRYLVFESQATGLVDDDSNGRSDVFRVDTHSGAIIRVSVDNSGAQIDGDASEASISADGQRIVFTAPDSAVSAVLGESRKQRELRQKGAAPGQVGIFLRNLLTGTTMRVGSGVSGAASPQIAADGSALVFSSADAGLPNTPIGSPQVYVQALPLQGQGNTLGELRCVSCKVVSATGADTTEFVDGSGSAPVVSADGRWVAWQSTAKNVIAGAPANCPESSSQILLRDLLTGALQTVSAPAAGGSCTSSGSGSIAPSLDAAGDTLVFQSDQPLLPGDDNGLDDVFLLDLSDGDFQRLSESVAGADGNGASLKPSISGDGASVVFSSAARNLVSGDADNNEVIDVLAWRRDQPGLRRVSSNVLGDQADGASGRPVLSHSGALVAFESDASNLLLGSAAAPDGNGTTDVFQTVNPAAPAPLQTATWWKQSESGWGLQVIDQGNLLAPAWFTYDVDGEPTWFLISGAFLQADGSYRGDLFRFTGVPFAQITGPAADIPTPIGDVRLRFADRRALQFDYTVQGVTQSKSMTRFPFGVRELACRASADATRRAATNYSDVWWGGEATPGWGLFLIHIDDQLFAAWYTYDDDREAVFFVIPTARQEDGSFAGGVFRQANGVPFSMIDEMPPSPGSTQIGSASLRFSDGANGVFSYSVGSVQQSKPITRLQVGSVASTCETVPLAE